MRAFQFTMLELAAERFEAMELSAFAITEIAQKAESVARQSGWESVLPHPEMLPRLTGCLSQNAPAQFILFIGLMRTRCG